AKQCRERYEEFSFVRVCIMCEFDRSSPFYNHVKRWCGHLMPGVNLSRFTPEEDNLITSLALSGGIGWTAIAERVGNGRTVNSIKNNWNQRLSKMLKYNRNGHVEIQYPEAAQQQPSVVVQANDHANEGTEYSSSVDRRNIPDIECARGLLLLVTTGVKE
ncbi:8953_t:CDS:2, partial [Acaulospora morrowiae]